MNIKAGVGAGALVLAMVWATSRVMFAARATPRDSVVTRSLSMMAKLTDGALVRRSHRSMSSSAIAMHRI